MSEYAVISELRERLEPVEEWVQGDFSQGDMSQSRGEQFAFELVKVSG